MINEYENLLRKIVLEFLAEEISEYKISEERTSKWLEKKEIEAKKNKGILFEKRLIYYSDFYDLKTIILKNWDKFMPVFLNKKRFEIFFDEVESYRNTVMHGRNLTKSQNLILEGILTDTKNLKTVYHNKNEMKDDFFIRIDRVSDNLGNIWGSDLLSLDRPVLRVGDEYEVLVEATDPKGREIEYDIYSREALHIVQKENRFNFTIENSYISKSRSILVSAKTPNSEYKNFALFSFDIIVLPE
ncbi:MAG: hypothetical protein RL705_2151 [Bacteroidota bacterium]|jgi:hypothetical protein